MGAADYDDFIKRKVVIAREDGLQLDVADINPLLKDHQPQRAGRSAPGAQGCGTGAAQSTPRQSRFSTPIMGRAQADRTARIRGRT